MHLVCYQGKITNNLMLSLQMLNNCNWTKNNFLTDNLLFTWKFQWSGKNLHCYKLQTSSSKHLNKLINTALLQNECLLGFSDIRKTKDLKFRLKFTILGL